MSERVTFGESSTGLMFFPHQERAPAVVLIHEWWGVNQQIQRLAQRWADAGFVVIVPDLFHGKTAPDATLEDRTQATEAKRLMSTLDFPGAVSELVSAAGYVQKHPRSTGKVAVTGYCMGGALTFLTACAARGLSAAVPFYGMPPSAEWSKLEAPILAHFATHDDWATVAGAEQIKAELDKLGKHMELHAYDAHHAFCNDNRPEVYNAAAAQQAWDRTLAFVKQHTS